MKPDPVLLDRPAPTTFIHRQDCRCPACPGGRRALNPITRACLLFAAGLIVGTAIVATSGRLGAALRALFGL